VPVLLRDNEKNSLERADQVKPERFGEDSEHQNRMP
jgi:hypothetical protein